MAHPKPRKWVPKHPEKYVGNLHNIVARSSWEVKFLNYCDNHPEILKYASEELVIPYFSPVDQRWHRYYVDFVMLVRTKSGEIKRFAVEVKPFAQTQMPTLQPKNSKQRMRLINEISTYAVNQAKWKAAQDFCGKKDMEFVVITEKELYK